MFKATPIDMISAPNYWAPIPDKMWVITAPNAQTLWFELEIQDSLGTRPYVAAVGATIVVTFQRSDLIAMNTQGNLVNTVQSVTKNGAFHATNRSLVSLTLSALDVRAALSGSAKFTLTESAVATEWVQNWMIKKLLTDPGY